jgi:hypothetical protein
MSDIRRRLDALLDAVEDEKLKALIEETLDATKLKWAFCSTCKEKVQVEAPDLAARGKILTALIQEAKGKPPEQKEVTVRVSTLEELEALPDAELIELAAYTESPELPPAA